MVIYVDYDFKCYATNPDGTFREVVFSENARIFFAGKCTIFIEGYRFVPEGETWTRSNGTVFHGEIISLWKDYNEPYN